MSLSLIFFYSPMSSATRVHWALEELEVPYEKKKLDLTKGEQRTPEYLKLNPNGKIPLLVAGGRPIFESLAQLLFLGEEFGVEKKLFPAPGLDRADAFKWMAWGSVSVHDAIVRVIKNGERVPEEQRNAKAKAAAIDEIRAHFGVLDEHLAGKSFVLGESFSLVDVSLAAYVPFVSRLGADLGALPNVQAWSGRCMTRPALARVMQSG